MLSDIACMTGCGETLVYFMVKWKQEITVKDKMPWNKHIDGLTQDCSSSIANALELLQSFANYQYALLWIEN